MNSKNESAEHAIRLSERADKQAEHGKYEHARNLYNVALIYDKNCLEAKLDLARLDDEP